MPQSLSSVLVHVVLSIKNRLPMIGRQIEQRLWAYRAQTCTNTRCPHQKVGGTPGQVHLVSSLGRTVSASTLVEKIKTWSSKWMKAEGVRRLAWQNGYGAFSMGQSQLDDVIAYVVGQQAHHRRRTLKDECRAFLNCYKIPYGERYVWD